MDDIIRDLLITKCQQLAEGLNVRSRNAVAWMTKDVEGRLMPLLRGEADARRIPFCGAQTTVYVDSMLRKLRTYYKHIENWPEEAQETEADADGVLFVIPATKKFRFQKLDDNLDQRVQLTFEQMTDEITDTRSRNLIRTHLKNYRLAEPYINNNKFLQDWIGLGTITLKRISVFLDTFRKEYESIISADKRDADLALLNADYSFLKPEERNFVRDFYERNGRYPMLYIASRYFLHSDDRKIETYARLNGIKGPYETLWSLSKEYGLSFERTRQLSKLTISEKNPFPQVWAESRWAKTSLFTQEYITESNTNWAETRITEGVPEMSFYAALAIIALVRPIVIISIRTNGTRANGHRAREIEWKEPDILFAYDNKLSKFQFRLFLKEFAHDANLQKIVEKKASLSAMAERYFQPDTDENIRSQVISIIREVILRFPDVSIDGDEITFHVNRINYSLEIYNIIKHHGEAMTVEAIFQEFKRLHPEDHHKNSKFVRSYMLIDDRFISVGKKSTYQLREWNRFSGTLGELAAQILDGCDEPMTLQQLCRTMVEMRNNTTLRSCESTIYLGVKKGKLQYFITEEQIAHTSFVGLANKTYPACYWASPLTVEGVLASMHRFIKENERWPYALKADGIESTMHYALRKYTHRLHVTKEELKQYEKGMADIPKYQYPRNEREASYIARCQTLIDFHRKHGRLPSNTEEPLLMQWYQATKGKRKKLDDFRKYHFRKIAKAIQKK
ncbi:MAG: hypothetical protein K6F94_09600 [Bacteroidaceae bacterium]|nr:hypothetical protein [Bacteroidaceae bacterium]